METSLLLEDHQSMRISTVTERECQHGPTDYLLIQSFYRSKMIVWLLILLLLLISGLQFYLSTRSAQFVCSTWLIVRFQCKIRK